MSGALPSNAVSANGVGVVSDSLLNAFVQAISTAPTLRSFVGLSDMTINLLGITAPGDGLGGTFYWMDGTNFTDDNVNVIVPYAAAGQGAWLRNDQIGTSGAFLPISGGTITGNLTVDGTSHLAGGGEFDGTFGGNPTFSGNVLFSGTVNVQGDVELDGDVTVAGAVALNGGGTLTGTFTGGTLNSTFNGVLGGTTPAAASVTTLSTTGATSFGQRTAKTFGSQFNLTSNNQFVPASLWASDFVYVGNSGGSGSPLTGFSYVNSSTISDSAFMSGAGGIIGWNFEHDVVPNGTSGSGPRTAFGASLLYRAGGTYTNAGIGSGGVINCWAATNLGGTSGVYAGALNGFNATARLLSGATFAVGASGIEIDTSAETGSSYDLINQLLLVSLGSHSQRGYVNENTSIVISAQVGALADLMYGLRFGSQGAALAFDPYSKLIFSSIGLAATRQTVAANMDFSNNTVKFAATRQPFRTETMLQATAITGVTRLTTDGGSANGFVYDVILTNAGSGFTSHPTFTVTGGTGSVIHAEASSGTVGPPGVYNPGTGVPAEASVAITGGSGATATLVIGGNTLNFPINTAVHVDITLTATTFTHGGTDAVTWKISFGAYMSATASTTAIIGSPSWAVSEQTTGAAAKFSGSAPAAPAADTTLGAINVSITPTTGTWDVAAWCEITRTSRA